MKEQIDAWINDNGNLMEHNRNMASCFRDKEPHYNLLANYYEGQYDMAIKFRTFAIEQGIYLPAKTVKQMKNDNDLKLDNA